MLEFLQAYGLWILLGGAFLILMTRGGGCGMGHSQAQGHDHQDQDPETGYRRFAGQSRLDDPGSQSIAAEKKREENVKTPVGTHAGGCH